MAAVLVLAATVRADAAEPKRVMLLYSLGRDFKPWSECATTIRRELTQQAAGALADRHNGARDRSKAPRIRSAKAEIAEKQARSIKSN